MPTLEQLESRIAALEARNARVDTDKMWETSITRRALIAVLTYLVIALYMGTVIHINPWINALVPALAFFVSTLTLQVGKRLWLGRTTKKEPTKRP